MKESKQMKFKDFPINNIEDALMVLGDLILEVMLNLEKYKIYQKELMQIITEYCEIDKNMEITSSKPVPEKVFTDLDDKIQYRQMCMIKYIADMNKDSFSYQVLRKELKNKKYISELLPESVSAIINNFLDIRNWSFHNTKSRYSAIDEVAQKTIPKELKGMVTIQRQLNPQVAEIHEFFNLTFLLSLDIHMSTRIEQTELVLKHMKIDYENMYSKLSKPLSFTFLNGEIMQNDNVKFEIIKTKKPKDLFEQSGMVTQVSMGMQKKKYDGSNKDFEKWTLRKIDEENHKNS